MSNEYSEEEAELELTRQEMPAKKERRHGDTIYLYTVPESINRACAETTGRQEKLWSKN